MQNLVTSAMLREIKLAAQIFSLNRVRLSSLYTDIHTASSRATFLTLSIYSFISGGHAENHVLLVAELKAQLISKQY